MILSISHHYNIQVDNGPNYLPLNFKVIMLEYYRGINTELMV